MSMLHSRGQRYAPASQHVLHHHLSYSRSKDRRTAPAGFLVHEEGDVQLAARVVEASQAALAGLRDGGALGTVVRHHQLHRLRDVRKPLLHLQCTSTSAS